MMKHYDPIYARGCNSNCWEAPPIIERLSHTLEAVRARMITQSNGPNYLSSVGTIPDRFNHGMGVAFLTSILLKRNSILADNANLYLAAALMHDWGLPCLSHLPEYFLKKLTGYDGESYLKYVLEETDDAIYVLEEFDVDYKDVVMLVTGKYGKEGEFLKGSIDLDNLDNVLRYSLAASIVGRKPNIIQITSAFRFNGEFWVLMDNCLNHAKRWQKTREGVYGRIYKHPHLSMAMMIFRAIDLIQRNGGRNGDIDADFFLLNDNDAIEFLLQCEGHYAINLVNKAIFWEWYDEVFSIESPYQSSIIGTYAEDNENRGMIADLICEELNLKPDDICVYVGKGKEKRKITLPFISDDGEKVFLDDTDDTPIVRFKVFANPDLPAEKINLITDLASKIASGEELIF